MGLPSTKQVYDGSVRLNGINPSSITKMKVVNWLTLSGAIHACFHGAPMLEPCHEEWMGAFQANLSPDSSVCWLVELVRIWKARWALFGLPATSMQVWQEGRQQPPLKRNNPHCFGKEVDSVQAHGEHLPFVVLWPSVINHPTSVRKSCVACLPGGIPSSSVSLVYVRC